MTPTFSAWCRAKSPSFPLKKERRRVSRIAILGGGGWGTALAIVLSRARRKHDISLWVHDPALAESMRRDRENRNYLPGHRLQPEIDVTSDTHTAISGAQILIGAIPTAHARVVYSSALASFSPGAVFVSAAKGLEPATHKRMSEVVSAVVSSKSTPPFAALSGPSFAAEVARGEPTAVVLATKARRPWCGTAGRVRRAELSRVHQ